MLLLRGANLSAIAYMTDPKLIGPACKELGFTFLGLVTNGKGGTDQGDHQAIVCKDADGRNVTANRGTQVDENFNLMELVDDARMLPLHLAGGTTIAYGADDSSIIHEVMRLLNPSAPWDRYGHSKGGFEAETGRRWLPPDADMRVFSYGAPACADAAFWPYAYGQKADGAYRGLFRVIAWHDFAPGWGLEFGMTQPDCPAVLVKPGQSAAWYDGPPVYADMLSLDGVKCHSITASYIADLSKK